LNAIVSTPTVLLDCANASRSDPAPKSFVLVTVNTASSNRLSSGSIDRLEIVLESVQAA
jgi:hypothetical protein